GELLRDVRKGGRPAEVIGHRSLSYFVNLRLLAAGRIDTTVGRFNCGELTMHSPVPSSGHRAHNSPAMSPVVAIRASRLCMLRRLCTRRVLHSSKISGGRWPGCWLTNAVASQRFRPRRVTVRNISNVACIVGA